MGSWDGPGSHQRDVPDDDKGVCRDEFVVVALFWWVLFPVGLVRLLIRRVRGL